jgi:hypothetical protein
VLKNLWLVSCLLLFNNLQANYIYESGQSLIDLTNQTNTTNLNSGDDQLSNAFNLDFTFTFYENDYTSARMATNGCLHFGLGTGNINYNNYCGDYTPDPLPQYNYTLFPFWTDLIRDNNSKMLAKNFSDKTVFGWYDMREYYRESDNSFEVILWTNNTYEFRYGALDIIRHDVLIGEQGKSDEIYTYYYHDECNTGTTNTSTCYSYDWNASDKNTNLEGGGSLYSEDYIDCSDPLNDSSCDGYEAAYLNQQCDIDQLYSETCPFYWEAYDDLQCDIDPQYAPFCPGYQQEASVAYYVEQEFDYGYEEDFSYEEPQEEIIIFDYEEVFIEVIPQEVYVEEVDVLPEIDVIEEIITEPFQEPVVVMTYNDFIAEEVVVNPVEELIQLFEFETIIREELENEEIQTETIEVLETIQEIDEVREVAESREEISTETEEETEELVAEETSTRSGITSTMLNVVRNTISIASASSNNTSTSNSTNNTNNNTASSSSGISTTNSPSMSDQITSANAQNNMVLSLNTSADDVSGGQTQSVTTIITPLATLDSSPQVVMAEVQVQNMQGEISTAVSGAMTQSEADQIADQIIANNIKEQQEELQEESQETGEYADQSTLVAYLGYVPAFEVYKGYEMPKQDNWYTPRDIYSDAVINDNNEAFYGLSSASLNTLGEMIELQPSL